jgi:predicted alpha/beta hydrolase
MKIFPAQPTCRGAEVQRLCQRFQGNSSLHVVPKPIIFPAVDGYELHGHYWGHESNKSSGAVLINGATGLKCSYYSNYAQYLSSQGFNVLIFDYRGVGLSRRKDIRTINATKRDWGLYDTEGAIQKLIQLTPENQPLVAVCSSIGGFTLGLAPSARYFQRALFVGCQYAYCQDYLPEKRMEYLFKWHFVMPLVTMICGYFPGSLFGWSEDLPKGVALEWGLRLHPDFYYFYHLLPHDLKIISNAEMKERMAKLTTEVLTIADIKDEFATPAAVNRLMEHYIKCKHTFVQIDSSQLDIGTPMGHVGFFNKRCKEKLWIQSSEWLLHGSHRWKEMSSRTRSTQNPH